MSKVGLNGEGYENWVWKEDLRLTGEVILGVKGTIVEAKVRTFKMEYGRYGRNCLNAAGLKN